MAGRKRLFKNGSVHAKRPIPGTSRHLLSALGSNLPFWDRQRCAQAATEAVQRRHMVARWCDGICGHDGKLGM